MTPAVAWLLLPTLLLAFALLALALERHHLDLLAQPLPRSRQRRLRRVAVALLVLCALAAQRSPQPSLAWVQLLVAASGAALVVALAISALGPSRR